MQVITLKGRNKKHQQQMKRYPKKPNHLLLTVSSKVNVRHINTEKTETAPHNNFMIRCCDTFLDRDKVQVQMPKKYGNKKEKQTPRLEILDDSVSIPSSFSLKTFIAQTSESQKNESLWNLDSPVNKLYD